MGSALVLLGALLLADPATDVARAFREGDVQKRAESVAALGSSLRDLPEKERTRAAAALDKGMKGEVSPEVRNAALDVLFGLRCERALERFVLGASDPDPQVRAFVRRRVKERADARVHETILRLLREDESWRFRCALADLLRASGRPAAIDGLIRTLEDPHSAVSSSAAEALDALLGGGHGLDPKAWRARLEARRAERPPPGEERRTTAADDRIEEKAKPVDGVVPTLFTIPIRCKLSLFVVDMSSSLRQGARSLHLQELKSALLGLPSDVRFNVLCFDQRLFFFAPAKQMVPATVPAKGDLEKWLDTLPAGEKTDVRRSLVTGLAMLKEALEGDLKAEAELFVLTDGVETVQTLTDASVEAQFERLPAGRCRIHVVALSQKGTPALRTLAERTGGRFVEAPSR